MKQVLQNFKTGEVSVEEVPRPIVKPGCVLVRNMASLISIGTEAGTVRLGQMSLLGKARARPEQIGKVLKAIRSEGLVATINAVNRTLDLPVALGYSSAGIVHAAGDGVTDLVPGTPVACGGAGMACHAEFVTIPRNLCVPIPPGVPFEHAAFTTVGSVALQAVRIADSRIGENVAVIGLGLVGLLTVQILRASGCRVFGIDVDPQRVDWANSTGACAAALRSADNIRAQCLEFSDGFGMDAVIVTAAVNTNDPVAFAGEIARQKGRVVVVGRTVIEAPRETYLFKELEIRTAYAYGPGTGDATYELEGYDYPIGYVRWTENRNMQCFLEMIRENRIDPEVLITSRWPIEKAADAFSEIAKSARSAIGVVITYNAEETEPSPSTSILLTANTRKPRILKKDALRIGVIGAGSFAANFMVPLLAGRKDLHLQVIASSTGIKAAALAKKYGFAQCTSEAREVLESPDVDCVFLLTRHGTHAAFAEQALKSGKHVFVEKPLALDRQALDDVAKARRESGRELMIGFNRRFSPYARRMKAFFGGRCQPMIIDFRGSVGYRPPEHWLHHPVDGGGVILGEACHYIDFCRWLVDSPITSVNTWSVGGATSGIIPEDNVTIALRFQDGSMANILYLSNGATGCGRERCEIHSEGKSAVWEDFKYLKLATSSGFPKIFRSFLFPRKGYKEELDALMRRIWEPAACEAEWLEGQLDSSAASIIAAGNIL